LSGFSTQRGFSTLVILVLMICFYVCICFYVKIYLYVVLLIIFIIKLVHICVIVYWWLSLSESCKLKVIISCKNLHNTNSPPPLSVVRTPTLSRTRPGTIIMVWITILWISMWLINLKTIILFQVYHQMWNLNENKYEDSPYEDN